MCFFCVWFFPSLDQLLLKLTNSPVIGNQSDHDRDKDFWPIPVDRKSKKFDIKGGVKSQLLLVSLTPKRQSPEHAGRPWTSFSFI